MARSKVKSAEFTLVIDRSVYRSGDRFATLRSEHLDKELFVESEVLVEFETYLPEKAYEITSFEVNSLVEFVSQQAKIKRVLAVALAKDAKRWSGQVPDGGLWKALEVVSLVVHQRKMNDEKRVQQLRRILSRRALKDELAASDESKVASAFTLVMKCQWDEEHQVKGVFRDGKLEMIVHS